MPTTDQPPAITITSAAQLFAGLRSPDPATRAGVLSAIAADPGRALQYGPHDGVALPDALIALVDPDLDYPYWRDIAEALSRFTGPAVTAFFLQMLQTSTGPESSFPAAERLGLDDHRPLLPALREVLLDDDDTHLHRVSAVASILRDDAGLDPRTRVRLAVADAHAPPAPVTPETLTWWLHELDGPYREPVRTRMEDQGAAAARGVAAAWDLLPAEQQPWMLGWVAGVAPETARSLAAQVLTRFSPIGAPSDMQTVAAALGYAADLDPDDPLRHLAGDWTTAPDPVVRAAAAAASSRPPQPEEVLAAVHASGSGTGENPDPATDADLLTVLIRRLAGDRTALPVLTVLLEHHHWEIRAAARDALADSAH